MRVTRGEHLSLSGFSALPSPSAEGGEATDSTPRKPLYLLLLAAARGAWGCGHTGPRLFLPFPPATRPELPRATVHAMQNTRNLYIASFIG